MKTLINPTYEQIYGMGENIGWVHVGCDMAGSGDVGTVNNGGKQIWAVRSRRRLTVENATEGDDRWARSTVTMD